MVMMLETFASCILARFGAAAKLCSIPSGSISHARRHFWSTGSIFGHSRHGAQNVCTKGLHFEAEETTTPDELL